MGNRLEAVLTVVTTVLDKIGGTALTLMMLLTVTDVLLRAFGHPIIGTYEIVGLSMALVIGLTIPKVSLDRGNIQVEVLLDRLPKGRRAVLNTCTRLLAILLFLLVGYNLITVGNEIHMSGEVSPTLRIPAYPLAYAVAIACFIECCVFLLQIIKIWRGQYE